MASQFLRSFDDHDGALKSRLIGLYGLLILANVAAWIAAFVVFGDRPVLLGTAALAYVFGLRHAVDADHIAAIDNVVRKLMQEGKKPLSVGFFFSLGHSTIVVLAAVAIAATAAAFQDRIEEFHTIGGVIGTAVSAVFLLGIGIVNLFVLKGVWAGFHRVRRGEQLIEEDLNRLLSGHGFVARFARPLFRMIGRSWHMYPLGFLFGLGFDTATEVGLLAISATQAAQGMPIWSVLLFPALFTAGMALVDTTDSVLMVGAYGWAFVKPIRKLWYNMTITAASVAVALFIGGLEALGLISEKLQLSGGVWDLIGALNDNLANFGFVVIGIFIAAWALSVLVYRWKGYDRLAVPIGSN
ncbi:MAG TPA: HoxN/HupN/NixA family nickel/cobalt transporter [Dongiaceae bacterium]|nr:HoxN/HupN/NixA family nickel/cobalt transporter [Dongiaceae bacterium]